jgi:dUTP pyrophosphatase
VRGRASFCTQIHSMEFAVGRYSRYMLKVQRLSPHATLPTVAHPGEDIGYDLYASEDVLIRARDMVPVRTGIAIEFSPKAGGVVKTRSSVAKKRLMCNAGVIDAGYRGEVLVIMENLADTDYEIHRGDKIAQLLEHPFMTEEVVEEELTETARGAKGFGSSGS